MDAEKCYIHLYICDNISHNLKFVFRSVFSASQGTTSDSMMGEDITEPSQDMSSAWAGMSFLTDPYL